MYLCSQINSVAWLTDGMSDDNILDIAPKETMEELNAISDELLKKAGLIEIMRS